MTNQTIPSQPTVFVVDDDAAARNSVRALVQSMGMSASPFASAEEFLQSYGGQPGCLVTDVRLLGMSGLDLQDEMRRRNIGLPVIVMTGHARTPLVVRAIQNGAVMLLEKPYAEDDLWNAIRAAIEQDAAERTRRDRCDDLRRRLASLTPKEREVLDLIVAGHANKVMARQLGLSERGVENRRREVFTKMRANSVAELVRIVFELEQPPT